MRGHKNAIVVAFSCKIFREGFSEKVTFGWQICGKNISGKGNIKCKSSWQESAWLAGDE